MLATPIRQDIRLTRTWVATDLAWNALVEGGKTLLIAKFNPLLAAGSFVQGMTGTLLLSRPVTRAQVEGYAAFKRRRDLQQIVNLGGIHEIDVLSTNSFERRGLVTGTVRSTSIVFVKTQGNTPAPFRGEDWIEVKDPHQATVEFELKIQGIAQAERLSVSLNELFNGVTMDEKTRGAWIEKLDNWRKPMSILKRNFENEATIETSIEAFVSINNEPTRGLGEFATGKGVDKILGTTLGQKISNWVRSFFRNEGVLEGKQIKTSKAEVVSSSHAKCIRNGLLKRLKGQLYLQKDKGPVPKAMQRY